MASTMRFIILVALSLLAVTACGGDSQTPHSSQTVAEQVAAATVNEYTCSMHPSVRSNDPNGQCPICGMDLIPVRTSQGSTGGEHADHGQGSLDLSDRSKALASIETEPARYRTLQKQIAAVGVVAWNARSMRTLSAWTDGRIDQLYVNAVGDQVERGQAVAQLYSPELFIAQQEYVDAVQNVQKLQESDNLLRSAEQMRAAAEHRLALLGVPTAHIEKLAQEQTVVAQIDIQAPVTGIVTATFVLEGQYITTGSPIASVVDPSTMWVLLEIYQHDLPWLSTGLQIELQLANQGQKLTGTVVEILPELSAQQIAQVRVEVANTDLALRPGSFIKGNFNVGTDNVLTIPRSAILFTGSRSLVYVADGHQVGVFHQREVVLGERINQHYIVHSGLEAGEQVVSKGSFRIDSELQLQGESSMMSYDGNAAVAEPDMSVHNQHEQIMLDHQAVEIFPAYFAMWTALHNDQLEQWQQAAEHYFAVVEAVHWPEALTVMKQELLTNSEHLHHVTSISQARSQFFDHSKAMIELARMGVHEGEVFRAHCPMARDNAGADWLQPNNELLNPYFGASMLRCGSIEETIGGHNQ